MPSFMPASQSRDLLRRSMLPRPSHVTPQLNAALVTDLDEQIAAARGYAEAMIEQHNHALAGYGFAEVARLEKLREFYATGEEGNDAGQNDTRG